MRPDSRLLRKALLGYTVRIASTCEHSSTSFCNLRQLIKAPKLITLQEAAALARHRCAPGLQHNSTTPQWSPRAASAPPGKQSSRPSSGARRRARAARCHGPLPWRASRIPYDAPKPRQGDRTAPQKTGQGQGKAHEEASQRENKETKGKNRQDSRPRRVVDFFRV